MDNDNLYTRINIRSIRVFCFTGKIVYRIKGVNLLGLMPFLYWNKKVKIIIIF